MEAVAYVRISSDRLGERAGVERQREDCIRRAEQRDWLLTAVHEDNDQSARRGKVRPGFEAVLREVESGSVGVVIAWSLDRLQRNRRDELRLYEACERHKVILSLVNGSDLDFSTAAGRFVADALGSVARMEVDLKSDRQRRAAEQLAQAGKPSGGRRPFGYMPDKVTVNELEAQAARRGYADALAGVPLQQIARDWNTAGLGTPQTRRDGSQGQWAGDSVRRFLLNPRNAGLRRFRGEVVGPGQWAPIVPEETWRAAVDMLSHPSRRSGAPGAKRLLSGLAICGVCGSVIHGGGSSRQGIPVYRCSRATGHVARMSEPVDEYVGQVVVARLSRDDARMLLDDRDRPDVEELRDRANTLRQRLNGVAVEFADGELTASQLTTITLRLREQLQNAEDALADAGRVDVLGPLVTSDDVAGAWVQLGRDRQRAAIDMLATVVVHPPGRGVRTFRPETVEFIWRDPSRSDTPRKDDE